VEIVYLARYLYDGEFDTGRFSPLSGEFPDIFCGEIAYIVERARRILSGKREEHVVASLLLLDTMLGAALREGRVTGLDEHGAEIALTRHDLDTVPEARIALYVSSFFDEGAVFGDDEISEDQARDDETRQFRVEHFLAAFALVECRRATMYSHADWKAGLGAFYAIQAAIAIERAELLIGNSNPDDPVQIAIQKRARDKSGQDAARHRWSRLDETKKFAFARRQEMPELSRSAAIDRMLPEILQMARSAGEPLTGANPKETVTRWFRDAGIR